MAQGSRLPRRRCSASGPSCALSSRAGDPSGNRHRPSWVRCAGRETDAPVAGDCTGSQHGPA
jgi:hypothetical protein